MDIKLKTIFLVSGIFPGITDSVMLLGFECTINPQNLIKIVRAIFVKFEILNFFLMWTTLNFRVRGKTKRTARNIYMRTLYIEFERDQSIGLGSTFGDGHTDRQTDGRTDRQTDTHFFTMWERYKDEIYKIIQGVVLRIAILPSLQHHS